MRQCPASAGWDARKRARRRGLHRVRGLRRPPPAQRASILRRHVYSLRVSRVSRRPAERNAEPGRRFVVTSDLDRVEEIACSFAAATETHKCDKSRGYDQFETDQTSAELRAPVDATIENCSRAFCPTGRAEYPSSAPTFA